MIDHLLEFELQISLNFKVLNLIIMFQNDRLFVYPEGRRQVILDDFHAVVVLELLHIQRKALDRGFSANAFILES